MASILEDKNTDVSLQSIQVMHHTDSAHSAVDREQPAWPLVPGKNVAPSAPPATGGAEEKLSKITTLYGSVFHGHQGEA